MTVELFRGDAYIKNYNSRITEIVSDGIILDKTIFYPEGGGQPGDVGIITINENDIVVTGTRYENNRLVHLIEQPNALKINQDIEIKLNWKKRYSYMQVHTCLHLLCSIIPAPVTGGSIGDARGRLDFDLEKKKKKEMILNQLNELISKVIAPSYMKVEILNLITDLIQDAYKKGKENHLHPLLKFLWN